MNSFIDTYLCGYMMFVQHYWFFANLLSDAQDGILDLNSTTNTLGHVLDQKIK
jgi:hypothetical protein